jgi:hypothetical protein
MNQRNNALQKQPKEKEMSPNKRFVLNEARYIVDTLNPTNSGYCHKGDPEDDGYLRERVLEERLIGIISKLMLPVEKLPSGGEFQPSNEECKAICRAVFRAIKASHLNSFDPTLSIQLKFGGTLKREKKRMQDFTSLSLFRDDIENLLRDLYGDIESGAVDSVLDAVFSILEAFTKYLRTDLWKEHSDAVNLDYTLAIGGGTKDLHAMRAKFDLMVRACEIFANPSVFSDYTVEFAKRFGEHWLLPDNPTESLSLSYEMKIRRLLWDSDRKRVNSVPF